MVIRTGDAVEASHDTGFCYHIADSVSELLELSGCVVDCSDVKPSIINTEDCFVTVNVTGATANLCRIHAPKLEGRRIGWVKVVEVQPVTVGSRPGTPYTPEVAKEKAKARVGDIDPEVEQSIWSEMIRGSSRENSPARSRVGERDKDAQGDNDEGSHVVTKEEAKQEATTPAPPVDEAAIWGKMSMGAHQDKRSPPTQDEKPIDTPTKEAVEGEAAIWAAMAGGAAGT